MKVRRGRRQAVAPRSTFLEGTRSRGQKAAFRFCVTIKGERNIRMLVSKGHPDDFESLTLRTGLRPLPDASTRWAPRLLDAPAQAAQAS